MSKEQFHFDEADFRSFFDQLPKGLIMPIELREGLKVYDLQAFVTGRLNHIKAFENYRDPGNRSFFMNQLRDLRGVIEQRLKKREEYLRAQAAKQQNQ